MKKSLNHCIILFLMTAFSVLAIGCANTKITNQFVLMDELQKKPYANREVWVKPPDGEITKYVSDEQGVVKFPGGEKFNPENLNVFMCQTRSSCTEPPAM
jgi:hypothetical protein